MIPRAFRGEIVKFFHPTFERNAFNKCKSPRSFALVRFLEAEFAEAGYRFEKMMIRARFYTQIKVKQRRGVCTGQFAGKFDGFRRTNGRIFAW